MKMILPAMVGLVALPVAPSLGGLYGDAVQGEWVRTHPAAIGLVTNASNGVPPGAVIGDGVEFSADFTDTFGNDWHATADLQDNYLLTVETRSTNPSANIGSLAIVQFHLGGLDVPILNVEMLNVPFMPGAYATFDEQNLWVTYNQMAAYAPYNSYTFQVTVPEPGSAGVVVAATAASLRRRRGR